MNKSKWHRIVWRIINRPVCGFFRLWMRYDTKTHALPGPSMVISNHTTNYDPLLVASSFPRHQMYFVASEHLFRKGFISKAIHFLVAPIARRKGSSGGDTAMAMLRTLKKGNSVCIFGEGETTWNGITQSVFPGTGDIAKIAKAHLVTYRIEGGYFTAPRWGKGVRRGKMHGGIVNIYTPEQLQQMSGQEIASVIEKDLYENAWDRQKKLSVRYQGKNRARYMETALFLCPKCYQYGTLKGEGDQLHCTCGLKMTYTEQGTFDPPAPFENILLWDEWQHKCLAEEETLPAFRDKNITLYQLQQDHTQKYLVEGTLKQLDDMLSIHGHCFLLKDISHMALVQKHILVFTCQGQYYELHAPQPICFRKYLAAWQLQNTKGA